MATEIEASEVLQAVSASVAAAAAVLTNGDGVAEISVGNGALASPVHIDPELQAPELFLNRELTWLAFNRRVFAEALDEGNPLLERVKFLAITASNLDEFF